MRGQNLAAPPEGQAKIAAAGEPGSLAHRRETELADAITEYWAVRGFAVAIIVVELGRPHGWPIFGCRSNLLDGLTRKQIPQPQKSERSVPMTRVGA